MEQTGMVPVYYNADAATAFNVMKACYDGGVRAFEFTNRGSAAPEVFTALRAAATEQCPGMVLGIGSVVDRATALGFIESGADFVVSPVFAAEVTDVCRQRNIPYIPGCATPTEMFNAHRAGAEMVKAFPAGDLGGPSFVRNVLAPMSWLKIMVTGGVEPDPESLREWFAAGAKCAGMGSRLFPKAAIAAGDWGQIASLCASTLSAIARFRE